MIPETINTDLVPLDLPWRTTCNIVCKALIWNVSFDDAVAIMLKNYLARKE